MRRHPGAIKREQRAMRRARVALRGNQRHQRLVAEVWNAYPPGWSKCATCDLPAMDGHLTCGRLECDERTARQRRDETK